MCICGHETRHVRVPEQADGSTMDGGYEVSAKLSRSAGLRRICWGVSLSIRTIVPPQHGQSQEQAHDTTVLPSVTPSAPLILAFSELTISGYPAYTCPYPTLQVRGFPPPSHGLGSGWFATHFLYV